MDGTDFFSFNSRPTTPRPRDIVTDFTQPARVDKVHIDGIGRTKDDYVQNVIRRIFKIQSFDELMNTSVEVRKMLDKLGCFRNIGILIDTSKGEHASPQGYEVTFKVEERRRFVGGVSTMTGANEGSLIFGLQMPNIFGRGENLSVDHSIGSEQNKSSISFAKPFPGVWNALTRLTCFNQTLPTKLSGYTMSATGSLLDFSFDSTQTVSHNIQWEGSWRELKANSRSTSFLVREQSGHSFKSAIRHILTVDRRDDPIFPREGVMLKLLHEYAGLGGDVGFFKHDSEVQVNIPLPFDLIIQGAFRLGVLQPTDPKERSYNIHDLFFLGGPSGPQNLRGFLMKSIGSKSKNDFLGGQAYWSSALHMYAPLPFNLGRGKWGDYFRSHVFINAGNITDNTFHTEDFAESFHALLQNFRAAYGFGIVFRLGSTAKIELNYCFPLKFLNGDHIVPGLQLGVGVEFL